MLLSHRADADVPAIDPFDSAQTATAVSVEQVNGVARARRLYGRVATEAHRHPCAAGVIQQVEIHAKYYLALQRFLGYARGHASLVPSLGDTYRACSAAARGSRYEGTRLVKAANAGGRRST